MQVTASPTLGQVSTRTNETTPDTDGQQDAQEQNTATGNGDTTSPHSLKEMLPDSAVSASIAVQLPAKPQEPTASQNVPSSEQDEQVHQQAMEQRQSGLSDTATASANHQAVTIKRADGSIETRSGGSLAWRNNNPGNIEHTKTPHLYGSIGENGKFLIFSTEQAGFDAIIKNLKQPSYQALTVASAIKRMAPSVDHNDPVTYAKHIKSWTGIESNTKMSKLNETQLEAVANAIKRQEGQKIGQVTTTKSTLTRP